MAEGYDSGHDFWIIVTIAPLFKETFHHVFVASGTVFPAQLCAQRARVPASHPLTKSLTRSKDKQEETCAGQGKCDSCLPKGQALCKDLLQLINSVADVI